MDIGLDFRSTSGYVADPTNCTYVINDVYPVTRDGATFGYTGTVAPNRQNLSNAIDHRLAGIHYCNAGGTFQFQLDIVPGTYDISIAITALNSGQLLKIYDDATLLFSVASLGSYTDAQGNIWSSTDWPTSNVPQTGIVFASTKLIIKGTDGAHTFGLSHIRVTTSAGAPDPTSTTLTGPTSGVTGSASSNFTVTLDAAATEDVTITPSGSNGTVTFSPSTPVIETGQISVTFTANADTDGSHNITVADDVGLTNTGTVVYVTSDTASSDVIVDAVTIAIAPLMELVLAIKAVTDNLASSGLATQIDVGLIRRGLIASAADSTHVTLDSGAVFGDNELVNHVFEVTDSAHSERYTGTNIVSNTSTSGAVVVTLSPPLPYVPLAGGGYGIMLRPPQPTSGPYPRTAAYEMLTDGTGKVDIRNVNGTPVGGSGIPGDEWGPA